MLPEDHAFKAGDEVARQYGFNNTLWQICRIKRITPSGQIILEGPTVKDGDRYDCRGRKLGKRDRAYRFSLAYKELFLVTDEIRAHVADRERDSKKNDPG